MVNATSLSPKELSLEPIRADALILEQSEALVLHRGETTHRYRVIRLWEEAPAPFLSSPGLLPLKESAIYQEIFDNISSRRQ